MTPDPICVSPGTSVFEALELMKERHVRRLPVMKDNRLVGIVTELDLLKVSPSPATSLSIYEINHLISRMQVKDSMTKDVVTIQENSTVEEAALIMREKNIGAMPVMDGDRLVGIITESNIFDAFIEMLGLKRAGVRFTINLKDEKGVIAQLTKTIKDFDVNIISLATFPMKDGNAKLVIRIDTHDHVPLVEEIEKHGFKVAHVSRS